MRKNSHHSEETRAKIADALRGRPRSPEAIAATAEKRRGLKHTEEARQQAKAAYDLYVETRLYAKRHTYDDIIANGICLFGSVETVTRKVCRLHEMGIRHVATMHNFGALDPSLVERSMTLFAREVMPAFK